VGWSSSLNPLISWMPWFQFQAGTENLSWSGFEQGTAVQQSDALPMSYAYPILAYIKKNNFLLYTPSTKLLLKYHALCPICHTFFVVHIATQIFFLFLRTILKFWATIQVCCILKRQQQIWATHCIQALGSTNHPRWNFLMRYCFPFFKCLT